MRTKPRPWTPAEARRVVRLRLRGLSVWRIGALVRRNGSSVGALLRKPAIEDRILALQGL